MDDGVWESAEIGHEEGADIGRGLLVEGRYWTKRTAAQSCRKEITVWVTQRHAVTLVKDVDELEETITLGKRPEEMRLVDS